MKKDDHEVIRTIPTGVPGFDRVLGGGLPEYSFNLLAGGPGSGKTTLAHQIIFANATPERPSLYFTVLGEPGSGKTTLAHQFMFANASPERCAVYFTVLGEPTIKMLRYQRQFTFFDPALAGSAVQFINVSEEVLDGNLTGVLDRIVAEVERVRPGIVVVDSFRTIGGRSGEQQGDLSIEQFVQRLSLNLTSWEVTSFLLGEYGEEEQRNPVFTVADGVFWLTQATDRNSVVRKLQVVKARGTAPMPGLHTFRITTEGVQIFPRIPEQTRAREVQKTERLLTGIEGLDEMLGGGVIAGDAIMLTGPAGSGKSTIAIEFMVAGLENGETGVIAVFEEYPEEYLARADTRNPKIGSMIAEGKLELIYLRPLDLSVDEALYEILAAVERLDAHRVVIDSLSGFEVALAPTFREDFRESLYRLVGALTATGVTVFMTAEVVEGFTDVMFTAEKISFITDEIIIQRYVEIEGELKRVMAVIKMRGSQHSHELRLYELTSRGVKIGGNLREYDSIITGVPRLRRPKLADAAAPTKTKK